LHDASFNGDLTASEAVSLYHLTVLNKSLYDPVYTVQGHKYKAITMAQSEGIHTIKIPNSSAKCLMENWVEERAARHLDQDYPMLDKQKKGHKGLLTLKENNAIEANPTTQTTYTSPTSNLPPNVGPRTKLKEQFFWKKALEDTENNGLGAKDKEESKLTSEYRDNINILDFKPVKPESVFPHKLYGESGVSYWTEKRRTTGIHGVSQVKTMDSPFRKNTAFSKPIAESTDQPKPFEYEDYPNM